MAIEKISCTIDYASNGHPECSILINDQVVHKFIGNKTNQEKFTFNVENGNFVLKICHFGKNMKTEPSKFIEIKKICFNNVDIGSMIWQTEQQPELPTWQSKKDFVWKSNLYLGHNGYIEYALHSPILDFLKNFHTSRSDSLNLS